LPDRATECAVEHAQPPGGEREASSAWRSGRSKSTSAAMWNESSAGSVGSGGAARCRRRSARGLGDLRERGADARGERTERVVGRLVRVVLVRRDLGDEIRPIAGGDAHDREPLGALDEQVAPPIGQRLHLAELRDASDEAGGEPALGPAPLSTIPKPPVTRLTVGDHGAVAWLEYVQGERRAREEDEREREERQAHDGHCQR
jgi:hypothetical protein